MYKKVTIGSLLINGYEILKKAGIDSYQLDCKLLLEKVLEKDRVFIITNRHKEVDDEQALEYMRLVKLREKKMPVKYILGWCEFMGRNFIIREGVLIPRPDTEVLVEAAVSHIQRKHYKQICDVCCGSGIIGITIAMECKDTEVLSLDISNIAVAVTKDNISAMNLEHRVSVINSNLLNHPINKGLKFDGVISNPPYIRSGDIPDLMEDVKDYEPYIALSGGDDGLHFYREITAQAVKVLNPRGMLAFEIGYDQKKDVAKIMESYGFMDVEACSDLSGRDRVLIGFMPDNIS